MEALFGDTPYTPLLEAAQKGALILILRAMRFTPMEVMETGLCIAPIDLRLNELQRTEAIKSFKKMINTFLTI